MYLLWGLLFVFCFLYMLNLRLRGTFRTHLEGIVIILILSTLVVSFLFWGWKVGLITIALSFIFMPIAQPLSQYVAFKMLGFRTGDIHDVHRSPFNDYCSGKIGFDEMMGKMEKNVDEDKKRIEKILKQPSMELIVQRWNLTIDDVYRLYEFCLELSLNDIAWEIIENPNDLETMLSMIKNRKSDREIRMAFRYFPER